MKENKNLEPTPKEVSRYITNKYLDLLYRSAVGPLILANGLASGAVLLLILGGIITAFVIPFAVYELYKIHKLKNDHEKLRSEVQKQRKSK